MIVAVKCEWKGSYQYCVNVLCLQTAEEFVGSYLILLPVARHF